MDTSFNIANTDYKRVVIIGAGFAGLELAKTLSDRDYQVVLIDKNNFHQFQPLFYQVAMAGLEPSSIVFPLRKLFQKNDNVHIRVAEVSEIDTIQKRISTPIGDLSYDYLVIAVGAESNFFGNRNITEKAIPMKSVSEALFLRNRILSGHEQALITMDYDTRQKHIDIVVVGGGPTGVEVSGALAEMKRYILPKDYPELDASEMDIYLVQGGDKLLQGFSQRSSDEAFNFLKSLGVRIRLNVRVTDYDGEQVHMSDGTSIPTHNVIWAAGIKGVKIEGLSEEVWDRSQRLKVDEYMRVLGHDDIFAIGDIASMDTEKYPSGHPQVAQVAIQQGNLLGKNLIKKLKRKAEKKFAYKDKGSMATIGRNKAVADLPFMHFKGFFAWVIWLFVHLFALLGARNKAIVFLNWIINYITYDQSLRLIIKPHKPEKALKGK